MCRGEVLGAKSRQTTCRRVIYRREALKRAISGRGIWRKGETAKGDRQKVDMPRALFKERQRALWTQEGAPGCTASTAPVEVCNFKKTMRCSEIGQPLRVEFSTQKSDISHGKLPTGADKV